MLLPELLGKIVHDVVEAVSIPVTAKTRIGYSSEKPNAGHIAKVIEENGAKAITIHSRYREQGHSGSIHLDKLAEVVDAVQIPIIGNGGIKCVNDALDMVQKSGCTSVAIGQGSKGNPWIFSEIKGNKINPSIEERVKIAKRHLDLYLDWVGEERSVLEMRKHACWYLKGFDGAAAFRKRLSEAVSRDAFMGLLDELIE